jgi:cytochrome c
MSIPFGVIFMLLALGLFAAWLGESERKAKPASCIPLFLLAALLAPVAAGCESSERRYAEEITRGRADAGKQAIQRYGCGSCHRIPGVSGAESFVGPSLDRVACRVYIAGRLVNEPYSMIAWIRDPQHLRSPTAMPTLAGRARHRRLPLHLEVSRPGAQRFPILSGNLRRNPIRNIGE